MHSISVSKNGSNVLTDFSSDVVGVDGEVVLQLVDGDVSVKVLLQFLLAPADEVLAVLHRHVGHQRVGHHQVAGIDQRRSRSATDLGDLKHA